MFSKVSIYQYRGLEQLDLLSGGQVYQHNGRGICLFSMVVTGVGRTEKQLGKGKTLQEGKSFFCQFTNDSYNLNKIISLFPILALGDTPWFMEEENPKTKRRG